MEVAIDIKNLKKSYPGLLALDEISFQVKKGSVHGFLGPNGAGKSTTMKIITGLVEKSAGEYRISGKIGFLPEHPPLYPNMTVYDFLKFVLEINLEDKQRLEFSQIDYTLKKVGLWDVRDRLIGNLSKGYQQRVGIAQAIIHSPDIIILDEPTVGLDPVAINEIRNLINELKKEHTVLFSSHQLHEVELLCSEITLINKGKIVVSGKLEDISNSLKSDMKFIIKVLNFSEDLKTQMEKKFFCEFSDSNFNSDKKEWNLKIKTQSRSDVRKELTRFLAQEEIGLLEFVEEKSDLDEMFKTLIARNVK